MRQTEISISIDQTILPECYMLHLEPLETGCLVPQVWLGHFSDLYSQNIEYKGNLLIYGDSVR